LPVVVHRRALKRSEKMKMAELQEAGTAYPKGDTKAQPVISCRRPELNHYQGQRPSPFKKLNYASEHWESRRTIGDFFSFNGVKKPLSTNYTEFVVSERTRERLGDSRPDFERIPLDHRLKGGLKTMGFTHPTNIQQLSLKDLVEGQSGILAAETGNGKTLAFLLPLLHKVIRLKEAVAQVESDKSLIHLNRPLAVVVLPSRELAHQVFNAARDLCLASSSTTVVGADGESDDQPAESHHHFAAMGVNVRLALGGNLSDKMSRGLRPTDVLIGSAGALDKMFKRKFYRTGSCSFIVFDEADTLLDDTFKNISYRLMSSLVRPRPDGPIMHDDVQVVLSGATFPHYVHEVFGEFLGEDENSGFRIKTFRTGQLHRVPQHIYQKFIRVPKFSQNSASKHDYLMDAIDGDLNKKRSVMIFSNKMATSNWIYHFLKNKGISCEPFNSSVYWKTRYQSLERFERGEVQVLSCTDLASRGINTLNLHHVVNYDFPSNASDYLHRIGRVGRVGSKFSPKVTNLVCGINSVKVVQELELAVRMNLEVKSTDANIARVIKNRQMAGELGVDPEPNY